MPLLFLLFLLIPGMTFAQMTCFRYANDVLSCDRPEGTNRTIIPFAGVDKGIITDERGHVEPYTILPNVPLGGARSADGTNRYGMIRGALAVSLTNLVHPLLP